MRVSQSIRRCGLWFAEMQQIISNLQMVTQVELFLTK